MMTRASIDLGTNTCLLLIQKGSQILVDESRVVRLGEAVDQTRLFQPAAMERVSRALAEYAEKVRSHGISPAGVICVATSQARDAKNSEEFFQKMESQWGFQFRTLSGEQEARLTFLGALLPGMDPNATVVLDIGGGSTELMTEGFAQSVDLGSVRFTERYFPASDRPVTDEEFWACQEAIDELLQAFLPLSEKLTGVGPRKATLLGVAGTVTSLAAWHLGLNVFDSKKVDGTLLTRGDIHRMVEELKWRTPEERRSLPSMEPMRADVILAGALILWRVLEVLGFAQIQVSTRGLRYGVLNGEKDLA